MSTTAIAINCIEDIAARVSSIPTLKGRVFHVYSEEELVERTKGVSFPCAGVVYDGMMAIDEAGSTAKIGGSAELLVSVMIFFRQNTVAKTDPKATTVALMDEIRGRILATKSPSGHFWKFRIEAAVEGKQGLLTYVQRWATPVQLVGRVG